jgi:hypothetical protein
MHSVKEVFAQDDASRYIGEREEDNKAEARDKKNRFVLTFWWLKASPDQGALTTAVGDLHIVASRGFPALRKDNSTMVNA